MSTTPTTPNPETMPMGDLRTAAGLDGAPAAPAVEQPIAAPAAPAAPQWGQVSKAEDGTYQVTLATGEVFKGTADEVIAKQGEAQFNTKKWGQEWKQKAESAVPATPTPATPTTPQIDPQALATAQWVRDQNDIADAHDLGISVEQLRYQRQLALQTSPDNFIERQVSNFGRLCRDYVDTPENSAAMHEYFQHYQGFPTAEELKTAWAVLKYDGKVTPLQNSSTAQPPRPPVMPTAGATAPGNANQGEWVMPLADLRKAAGLG